MCRNWREFAISAESQFTNTLIFWKHKNWSGRKPAPKSLSTDRNQFCIHQFTIDKFRRNSNLRFIRNLLSSKLNRSNVLTSNMINRNFVYHAQVY